MPRISVCLGVLNHVLWCLWCLLLCLQCLLLSLVCLYYSKNNGCNNPMCLIIQCIKHKPLYSLSLSLSLSLSPQWYVSAHGLVACCENTHIPSSSYLVIDDATCQYVRCAALLAGSHLLREVLSLPCTGSLRRGSAGSNAQLLFWQLNICPALNVYSGEPWSISFAQSLS